MPIDRSLFASPFAKATLTFTDKPDGTVNVDVQFDPEVTDKTKSAAQFMAIRALETLQALQEDGGL